MLRQILLYLVLVGVPFCGLVAILQVGDAIDAPPALPAQWAVTGDGLRCLGSDTQTEGSVLQSGRFLMVDLGTGSFEARLRDDHIDGRVPAGSSGACPGASMHFDAVLIDRQTMRARLRSDDCPACVEAELVAQAVAPTE